MLVELSFGLVNLECPVCGQVYLEIDCEYSSGFCPDCVGL